MQPNTDGSGPDPIAPSDYKWDRTFGAHTENCVNCGNPAEPPRRVCGPCRNKQERERRQLRKERNAGRPCAEDGCDAPRHQMASQLSSYCRHHRDERLAASREKVLAGREPDVMEERQCPQCQRSFNVPSRRRKRFCSQECREVAEDEKAKRMVEVKRRREVRESTTHTWCSTCGPKLNEEFRPHVVKDRVGYCRECAARRAAEQRARHPEKEKRSHREKRFRYIYGIEPEAFDEEVKALDSICPTCHRKATLYPDHDHSVPAEGSYRGPLCRKCNQVLGAMEDSVETLERLIKHLRRELVY